MNLKSLVAGMTAGCAMLVSGAAWSCSMAGPNTHIGVVMAVDQAAKTFTIQDAETRQAVTFTATDAVLKGVQKAQKVIVKFEAKGDKLVASAVQV